MKTEVGILCGGKSSRMGTDKAALHWQGSTMLEHMVGEMKKSGRRISVSVASSRWIRENVLTEYEENEKIRIIPDKLENCGPLGGIYSVLSEAEADAVFFCAVDMPYVKAKVIEYLEQFLCSDYDGVIFEHGGRLHPLCGIYEKNILPLIEERLRAGDYRVRILPDYCRIKKVSFDLSPLCERTLQNINTPDEYFRAVRPMIFCISGVKNSGKTTLTERLIRYFLPNFPLIGVIKHDGHDFIMDHQGTDTFRAFKAGASKTAIFSSEKMACFEKYKNLMSDSDYPGLEKLLWRMKDMDIVILEGMKYSIFPKIEIIRNGISSATVCDTSSLIAVATDWKKMWSFPDTVPVVDLNDTKTIAEQILKYFGIKKI